MKIEILIISSMTLHIMSLVVKDTVPFFTRTSDLPSISSFLSAVIT